MKNEAVDPVVPMGRMHSYMLDCVIQALDSGISQQHICTECGLQRGWLTAVMSGRSRDPGVNRVECVLDWFDRCTTIVPRSTEERGHALVAYRSR